MSNWRFVVKADFYGLHIENNSAGQSFILPINQSICNLQKKWNDETLIDIFEGNMDLFNVSTELI